MKTPENMKEIVDSFKNGYDLLKDSLERLTETELDYQPKKKGWAIRQIVHHIADGDDLWKTAVKMALGNENAEFTLKWYTELTQIEWSHKWCYAERSINKSLAMFKANRDHIIQLLECSPDCWNKSVKFLEPDGRSESVPIGFVIKMQSDHVEHHVKRILEIRKEISDSN